MTRDGRHDLGRRGVRILRATGALPMAVAFAIALFAALALAACSASSSSAPGSTVTPGPLESNGPISWSEASSRVGEVLAVQGPVVSTGGDGSGGVVLNVGADATDPSRFVVMIPKDALAQFPKNAADHYDGQLVTATGTIEDRQGTATMVVRSPKQLTIGQ